MWVGRLVFAAPTDVEGRIISTPEAAAAMWERKILEAFPGFGGLGKVAEPRADSEEEEEDGARRRRSEVEAPISEAEWLPMVLDSLATPKSGKAVDPDALPADFLNKHRFWFVLPSSSSGSACHGVRRSESLAERADGMALVPKKAMLPSTLQDTRGVLCANVAGKVVAKVVRSQLVGPPAEAGEAGRRHRDSVACL